jgi:hypothetical protein
LLVHGLVGPPDEISENIVVSDFSDPDGDRCVVVGGQVGVHEREPHGDFGRGHVGEPADELVAAESNDQVVGAQTGPDRLDRLPQESISGGVAERVVRPLEIIDVDEGEHVVALRSLRPGHLPGQLERPGVPAVGAGELINGRGLPVRSGQRPVRRRGQAVV